LVVYFLMAPPEKPGKNNFMDLSNALNSLWSAFMGNFDPFESVTGDYFVVISKVSISFFGNIAIINILSTYLQIFFIVFNIFSSNLIFPSMIFSFDSCNHD